MVHRRIHVCPDERYRRSRDATSLVCDLDCDVLLSLCDDDLCHGEILLILASCFHDGAQGVLERLKEHV